LLTNGSAPVVVDQLRMKRVKEGHQTEAAAKPQDSIFMVASLDTPANSRTSAKQRATQAAKDEREKIEKEISRAVEDAVDKSV
jgi:hypothetical protein